MYHLRYIDWEVLLCIAEGVFFKIIIFVSSSSSSSFVFFFFFCCCCCCCYCCCCCCLFVLIVVIFYVVFCLFVFSLKLLLNSQSGNLIQEAVPLNII